MNVVVLGCEQLPEEIDFPPLDLPKFSWLQFLNLSTDDVIERCWRADVIISIGIDVNAKVIDDAFKLSLIIAADEDYGYIDIDAASKRGITVANIPGAKFNAENAQDFCDEAVKIIDAYNRKEYLNKVN